MPLPMIYATDKTEASRSDSYKERWHAIYKMESGLDYCRESAPLSIMTKAQATTWAQTSYERAAPSARTHIFSVALECW